jgi:heme/copper-type cytochrome/quinol oxidase subunit 2
MSMPHPIATILFWIAVACCLVAQVLIVRSVLAARVLPAVRPELPRARGSVEVLWAIVPAVALAVLLFYTWRAIQSHGTSRATAPSAAAVAAR